LDARRWIELNPNANRPVWSTLLKEQRSARPTTSSATATERLKKAPPAARRELLIEHLRALFSQALRLKVEKVDPAVALGDLGLTSLISLEIRNQLEQSLGLSLSVTLLFTYATIQALADHLMAKLFSDTDAPGAVIEPKVASAITEQVARMSPNDLLALFA
jgi:acyl carrier protein